MPPVLEAYSAQVQRWPSKGRHILAQYDNDSVIVYQAYRPAIAHFAVEHQRFGGEWSFERMSWIKPNFAWMMYRSGWAQKPGQERILAVRLRRAGFDELLATAVHSSYMAEVYGDRSQWQQRVKRSEVRLQWDPDHDPHGNKVERRAIQLGLRGAALRRFAAAASAESDSGWCLGIEDITELVHAQHVHVRAGELERLQTPHERVYPVDDPTLASHLGLTPGPD